MSSKTGSAGGKLGGWTRGVPFWHEIFTKLERDEKDGMWRILCRVFLQEFVRETDVVLDLGCGLGEFLRHIVAAKKVGGDIDPRVGAYVGANSPLVAQRCSRLAFRNDAVDCILLSNVLEHLTTREEVLECLGECWRVLREGGRILVLQPNFRYASREYFDTFDHHHAYTHQAIAEALGVQGFRIVRVIPRFLPYSTKSRLPKRGWLVYAYLKIPVLWRIFGKQMFIVGEKRTGILVG